MTNGFNLREHRCLISHLNMQSCCGSRCYTSVVVWHTSNTVVALLFLVYYKRKRSALVNLTKPHKESEENSYASSEHSHQQGSKYSESPEPGYDVIKPTALTYIPKRTRFSTKLKSFRHVMNPTHPSEYAA